MNQNLLGKYNIPVPRYTSYPPANYFDEKVGNTEYLQCIEQSNNLNPNHISFYIHIPFCRHLCYYCGCNSFPMASPEKIKSYIEAVKKEIKMVIPLLDKSRKVSQIHYGGGSPTSIPLTYIKEINELILSEFETIEYPEIAIECHPVYLNEKDWEMLSSLGFTRFSLGIQDFDNDV